MYIVSAAWESINIAAKCRDRVNLFLYSASCQTASWLSLREVYFFSEETVCNALLKEKGDLPCTAVLKWRPFSLSTKSHFPWQSSESLTRRRLVPKSRHQELLINPRRSESPACSASLRNRPWAGVFTSSTMSAVVESRDFHVNNACKKS